MIRVRCRCSLILMLISVLAPCVARADDGLLRPGDALDGGAQEAVDQLVRGLFGAPLGAQEQRQPATVLRSHERGGVSDVAIELPLLDAQRLPDPRALFEISPEQIEHLFSRLSSGALAQVSLRDRDGRLVAEMQKSTLALDTGVVRTVIGVTPAPSGDDGQTAELSAQFAIERPDEAQRSDGFFETRVRAHAFGVEREPLVKDVSRVMLAGATAGENDAELAAEVPESLREMPALWKRLDQLERRFVPAELPQLAAPKEGFHTRLRTELDSRDQRMSIVRDTLGGSTLDGTWSVKEAHFPGVERSMIEVERQLLPNARRTLRVELSRGPTPAGRQLSATVSARRRLESPAARRQSERRAETR